MGLFVRKKINKKLVQVNAFLIWIVWIMTTTKILSYLNFSQAIEKSIYMQTDF